MREREITPTQDRLTPETAGKELGRIWLEYYSGPRNQKAQDARKAAIEVFNSRVTPEALEFLETPTRAQPINGGNFLTEGQLIQRLAREKAMMERPMVQAKESVGARRHIRREKAYQRRGTPPKFVH